MKFRVDLASLVAPSRQLVEVVLDAVAAGSVAPGDKLPSVREVAVDAAVNPNTAAKAYRDLAHLGVVAARSGSGVFVADAAPAIARRERRSATLEAFRRASAEALRAGHDAARLSQILDGLAERRPVAAGDSP
ncbi:MAG TPA: GntR family transcriptional regulator [Planctomycetota bacterium]|nr:GntR family transcriptional regulator [Planctomycetota bacterium]